MRVGTGYIVYLAAFFVMIFLALLRIIPVNYFGEIVIAVFVGGLFYFWLNAWRETKKMIEVKGVASAAAEQEQVETERNKEEPIVAR